MTLAATSGASVLLLGKAMDAEKSQALALLQCLPPPPSLAQGNGLRVNVYA